MIKGIDVSSYQGKIDFAKVKQSGIDFVMIRAGWGRSNEDTLFAYNIKNALKNGLKVGVYWFIYAKDKNHLEGNISMCDAVIRSYKDSITLGVYADWEYDSDNYRPNFSNRERSLLVKQFIEGLSQRGYQVGLYANPDYINNKFDMSLLKQYKLWLAYYNTTEQNAKMFSPTIWQYTSKGKIDGISGFVDLDYLYTEIKEDPKPTPEVKKMIVNTKKDNLNIRKGPGQKYQIISSFKKGAIVEVLDNKNPVWYYVRGNDYSGTIVTGYVSKTYLKEI